MKYKALRIDKPHQSSLKKLTIPEPEDNEVLVEIAYSSLNYKDSLGICGKAPIYRSFPITSGIDLSGTIVRSNSTLFQEGDKIIAHGCGIGESIDGGLAEYARLHESVVCRLPPGLSLRSAMLLGTAGFTARLCIHRMEVNGQKPSDLPIAVSGASGGVGSFALMLLRLKGYHSVAISGKESSGTFLTNLGAREVIPPEALVSAKKPLEKAIYAGAVDTVGGTILSSIIPHTVPWGNITVVGLAESANLHTTVMPLILRGVSLLGISSANCPMPLRQKLWNDLGQEYQELNFKHLPVTEIAIDRVAEYAEQMIARKTNGRIIVAIKKETT